MNTVSALLVAMSAWLGTKETPPGSNETTVRRAFGYPIPAAWCAMTVSLACKAAGFAWMWSASCLQFQAWAKAGYHGLKYLPVSQARPGDIFIFKGGHHTGIVYYLEGGGFASIEGNWGDACVIVHRKDWSAIDGVIRLPFVTEVAHPLPAPVPAGDNYAKDPNKTQAGDRGDLVRLLQVRLNNVRGVRLYAGQKAWDQLSEDGQFGPATGGAVGAFQAAYGIPMNGVFDWATAGKLAAVEAFMGIRYWS